MALVGRTDEQAAIVHAFAPIDEGEGAVLALVGDAGIGKSALLQEVAAQAADRDLLLLGGRAAEHEADVPFGLVVAALDDHAGSMHARRLESVGVDLAAVLPAAADPEDQGGARPDEPGAAERFRYHRALRALLELIGRERPFVLVLDDVHWADEGSLEFILHLLRNPPRVPHLLVVATRPVEASARILDGVRTSPLRLARTLTVGPLDDTAAAQLVGDLPAAVRQRVVAEAGGNPLFLRELARVAAEGGDALPRTVLAAVQLELARLPAAARTLLEGAAVAGDPFDPELAAAGADVPPGESLAALDQLAAADLVRATGAGRQFAFRHPLVRRAVYDAAPPAWRLAAHHRVADALAARGASPAMRAYHVEHAALPGDEAAIALLTEAAQEAAHSLPATAARWYEAANRLLVSDSPWAHAALLGPAAIALGAAGRLPEARDRLAEVIELVGEPSELRTQLVAGWGRIEHILGDNARAAARLEEELAVAPPASASLLTLELAVGAIAGSDPAATERWALQTLELVTDDDHDAVRIAALGLAGQALQQRGDPAGAAAFLDEGARRFAAIDDDTLAVRSEASYLLGVSEMLSGRYQQAADTTDRGLRVMRRSRQGALAPLQIARTYAYKNLLDMDEALRAATAAEESARLQELEAMLAWALSLRSAVHWWRGESAPSTRAADESVALCRRREATGITRSALASLAMMHRAEEPERMIAEVHDAAGPELEFIDRTWATFIAQRLVRAAADLDRLDDADAYADLAASLAEPGDVVVATGRAMGARAEALLAREDAEGAAEVALDAVTLLADAGAALDAQVVRVIAGRALGEAGRRDEAIEVLQVAAAEASRGAALRLRDEAARELRRLGSRLSLDGRRGAGPATFDELSEREREIADLAARGQANKQIAATLFLSQKTVEHHLSSVYAKLGLRSRVELAALVGETAGRA